MTKHPKESTPEHNDQQRENLAQLEMAKHLYPDKPTTEAFLSFVGDPNDPDSPAKKFRTLLEERPELKEGIDKGDQSALKEAEEALSLNH